MKVFVLLSLLPIGFSTYVRQGGSKGESRTNTRGHPTRNLQQNKLSWPECVEESMTLNQCIAAVKKDIESGDHVLETVSVQSKIPNTDEPIPFFSDSLLRYVVLLTTNYMGIVIGKKDDGVVESRAEWNGRQIGPWNCKGLDAAQCCDLIKADVPDATDSPSLFDGHTHILCKAEEMPPIPFAKGGGVSYCEWELDTASNTFKPFEASIHRQETVRNASKHKLGLLRDKLQAAIDNGVMEYDKLTFEEIQSALLLHARGDYGYTLQTFSFERWEYLKIQHPEYNKPGAKIFTSFPNVPAHELPEFMLLSETIQLIDEFIDKPPVSFIHHVVVHSADKDGTSVSSVPHMSTSVNRFKMCVP